MSKDVFPSGASGRTHCLTLIWHALWGLFTNRSLRCVSGMYWESLHTIMQLPIQSNDIMFEVAIWGTQTNTMTICNNSIENSCQFDAYHLIVQCSANVSSPWDFGTFLSLPHLPLYELISGSNEHILMSEVSFCWRMNMNSRNEACIVHMCVSLQMNCWILSADLQIL